MEKILQWLVIIYECQQQQKQLFTEAATIS